MVRLTISQIRRRIAYVAWMRGTSSVSVLRKLGIELTHPFKKAADRDAILEELRIPREIMFEENEAVFLRKLQHINKIERDRRAERKEKATAERR